MSHARQGFVASSAVIISALAGWPATAAQDTGAGAIPIDRDDIAGVVTSTNGAEAGVWVIAETTALPTRYAKIVVTDDRGRYVIPDLPAATYKLWVRGYGLADSSAVESTPGKHVNLTALVAPDRATAAKVFPAA